MRAIEEFFFFCDAVYRGVLGQNVQISFISCGAVCYLYKLVLTFKSVYEILKCDYQVKARE